MNMLLLEFGKVRMGGATWDNNSANNGLTQLSINYLTIDPSNTTILYAATGGDGMARGQDTGTSINWTPVGPGGGGFLPAVAVVPTTNDATRTIYIGSNVGGFYRSTDNGQSYKIMNNGLKNYDVEGIVYDSKNPSTVYLITPGGPYKSTDGGENWVQKRNGFPALTINSFSKPLSAITMDPNNSNVLYAGVGQMYEDLIKPNTGKGEVWKTTDGAENWTKVNMGTNTIDPTAAFLRIVVDPGNSQTVYAATDKGLYKSFDAGTNWVASNSGLPNYQNATTPYVRNIVFDPTNSNIVYAVLYTAPITPTNQTPWLGGVYKSTDSGATWVSKAEGLQPNAWEQSNPGTDSHQTRNYKSLVIDPVNPNVLYLGSTSWWGAGVWKSTDGGNTWAQSMKTDQSNLDHFQNNTRWHGAGLPSVEHFSLAIDTLNPNVIFFSSGGMYATFDGGQYWHQMDANTVLFSPTPVSTIVPTATLAPTSAPTVNSTPTQVYTLTQTPIPTRTPTPTPAPTKSPTPVFTTTVSPTPIVTQPVNTLTPTVANSGFIGSYFDNKDFTNLKFTRIDKTINFNWRKGSPSLAINPDTFSISWNGYVVPPMDNIYTFYVYSDDGARVWINNKLIINKWFDHSAKEYSGTIILNGGQTYIVKVEYYENRGSANIKFSWSSPNLSKQILGQPYLR